MKRIQRLFCGLAGLYLLGHVALAEERQTTASPLTVIGTVRCSSCDLKKEKGAKSQCSVHGCQFSIKTERVTDAQGTRLAALEGKTYHLLLNDDAKPLTGKEHKGKRFSLTAKIYPDEGVIEVQSFSEAPLPK